MIFNHRWRILIFYSILLARKIQVILLNDPTTRFSTYLEPCIQNNAKYLNRYYVLKLHAAERDCSKDSFKGWE